MMRRIKILGNERGFTMLQVLLAAILTSTVGYFMMVSVSSSTKMVQHSRLIGDVESLRLWAIKHIACSIYNPGTQTYTALPVPPCRAYPTSFTLYDRQGNVLIPPAGLQVGRYLVRTNSCPTPGSNPAVFPPNQVYLEYYELQSATGGGQGVDPLTQVTGWHALSLYRYTGQAPRSGVSGVLWGDSLPYGPSGYDANLPACIATGYYGNRMLPDRLANTQYGTQQCPADPVTGRQQVVLAVNHATGNVTCGYPNPLPSLTTVNLGLGGWGTIDYSCGINGFPMQSTNSFPPRPAPPNPGPVGPPLHSPGCIYKQSVFFPGNVNQAACLMNSFSASHMHGRGVRWPTILAFLESSVRCYCTVNAIVGNRVDVQVDSYSHSYIPTFYCNFTVIAWPQ